MTIEEFKNLTVPYQWKRSENIFYKFYNRFAPDTLIVISNGVSKAHQCTIREYEGSILFTSPITDGKEVALTVSKNREQITFHTSEPFTVIAVPNPLIAKSTTTRE